MRALRFSQQTVRYTRYAVQSLFAAVTVWCGVGLYRFYQFLIGTADAASRPAGVEAFLPIGAMLSLRRWLFLGDFDKVHPAALVLFLIIIGSALILGRGFCSWICPVGTLSELISKAGRKMLARVGLRQVVPTGKLGTILSIPKYLLLAFFIYIGWFALNLIQTVAFAYSDYNKVSDLKMLLASWSCWAACPLSPFARQKGLQSMWRLRARVPQWA